MTRLLLGLLHQLGLMLPQLVQPLLFVVLHDFVHLRQLVSILSQLKSLQRLLACVFVVANFGGKGVFLEVHVVFVIGLDVFVVLLLV